MSRLPWMPSTLFEAKSESPNTTTRVSGLGPSVFSGGFAASSGAAPVTAAASVIGPGLSLPGSSAIFFAGQQSLNVRFGPASVRWC